MKNLSIFIVIFVFISACCEDHSDIIPGQDFIPEEILTKIRENGQPIYEGLNPPVIEGRFLIRPFIMLSSNIENDFSPGTLFAEQLVEFSDYDPNSLTLQVSIEQGASEGQGYGSFISGDGNNFTIYVRIEVTKSSGHRFLATEVYSGRLEDNGIRDVHVSYFIVDDRGDPDNEIIENGEGRLFIDQDGYSQKL